MSSDIVGLALCAVLIAGAAFILWRYPDFRRGFMHHWSSKEVAKRLDRCAEDLRDFGPKNRRRERKERERDDDG